METIYSERHRMRASKSELYGGQLVPPFERPERMDYILKAIGDAGLGPVLAPDEEGEGGGCMDVIARLHDAGYVGFLKSAWDEWQAAGFKGEAMATVWPSRSMPSVRIPEFIDGKIGYYCLAAETSISAGTWEAAVAAAQIAFSGAQRLVSEGGPVFSLCRPPGHHASRDQFGGYCFLNNAGIAAQHLLDCGAGRVAVLDVDFHHGNGTQAIFYDRKDVLFLSLHGDPLHAFPHYLGHADECGIGPGEGLTRNYPMPPGTPYGVWSKALDDALRRIADYGPDSLVVSLGVDTFERDPISFFKLKSEDFSDLGGRIAGLRLSTLFVMEGGYAVEEIGTNAVNVLTGFEGA